MSTTLTKHGAPTIDTVGYVGQKYVDLDSCNIYECKAINAIATVNDDPSHPHGFVTVAYVEKRTNEYIWEKVGGAGGGDDYDLVVNYDTRTNEVSLISGSAKAVRDKFKNGKMPNVVVCNKTEIYNDHTNYYIDYTFVYSISYTYLSDNEYEVCLTINSENSAFIFVRDDGSIYYSYAD